MKRSIIVIGILLMIGCKGPAGDRGQEGKLGPTGPTQIAVVSQNVMGNYMVISDPRLNQASGILVYNANSGSVASLPYYLPAIGINTYYVWTPGNSVVEIYNSQSAGAAQVVVTIILG